MEYMMQYIVIFGAFILIYYFLLIRPQRKKQQKIDNMRNTLEVGDKVVTIGGFAGRIVSLSDDRVVIEVGADRTKLTIMRWGISNVEETKED